MTYFLLKTEPATFSIDDLKHEHITSWGGVRNYQARNVLRDMCVGDRCFIYHSSCEVPAIMGIGEVVQEAYPDPLQFDRKSEYYDAGSKIVTPRWDAVDVQYVRHLDRPLPLAELQKLPALTGMRLLMKGNRLSVMPIDAKHADVLLAIE